MGNTDELLMAKRELRDIYIEAIGEEKYYKLISEMCKELHALQERISPLIKNPTDAIFRQELMKEVILKYENRDDTIMLYDIALDTFLEDNQ